MTPLVVLIHSPLVAPSVWSLTADELAHRGIATAVPDLGGDERDPSPLWRQHSRAAAPMVDETAILVGHSGAGALLPVIAAASERRPAGYVFVDAGLPTGDAPKAGAIAMYIDELYARGRRFPDWTDDDLRDVVPDPTRRAALVAALRPMPERFWNEAVPLPAGWPDAACGYLRFGANPAYESASAEARHRGWAYRELSGDHFHILVDPMAVADALFDLTRDMGIR